MASGLPPVRCLHCGLPFGKYYRYQELMREEMKKPIAERRSTGDVLTAAGIYKTCCRNQALTQPDYDIVSLYPDAGKGTGFPDYGIESNIATPSEGPSRGIRIRAPAKVVKEKPVETKQEPRLYFLTASAYQEALRAAYRAAQHGDEAKRAEALRKLERLKRAHHPPVPPGRLQSQSWDRMNVPEIPISEDYDENWGDDSASPNMLIKSVRDLNLDA